MFHSKMNALLVLLPSLVHGASKVKEDPFSILSKAEKVKATIKDKTGRDAVELYYEGKIFFAQVGGKSDKRVLYQALHWDVTEGNESTVFQEGAVCKIQGLRKLTQFNGKWGTIVGRASSLGRWSVEVTSPSDKKMENVPGWKNSDGSYCRLQLKPENIIQYTEALPIWKCLNHDNNDKLWKNLYNDWTSWRCDGKTNHAAKDQFKTLAVNTTCDTCGKRSIGGRMYPNGECNRLEPETEISLATRCRGMLALTIPAGWKMLPNGNFRNKKTQTTQTGFPGGRRRLTNQRLIDRFIRESLRCQTS